MTGRPVVNAAAQYAAGGVRERIEAALRTAGKDLADLKPADLAEGLASFEHFHSLGRLGTVALLEAAHITTANRVLDAGSSIGGTSRLLAAEHGCRVTSIDFTAEYCDIARWLNGLVQLQDRIDVIQGDVTDLPLPDGGFDLVVSQHVQMNVADKARLYSEARRVLRAGGRLALWDVTAGSYRPLAFPLPWADIPERSHLITADELATTVQNAGFALETWNDLTEFTVEAMTPIFEAPDDPLGLQLVVPDIKAKVTNLLNNARDNRLRLIQAVARAV